MDLRPPASRRTFLRAAVVGAVLGAVGLLGRGREPEQAADGDGASERPTEPAGATNTTESTDETASPETTATALRSNGDGEYRE